MSCELQKFRKGYIEKDIPMKQFDLDDNDSSSFFDYEDQQQNGLETADQSIQLDNFNDYSIETQEKIIFIYPPQLKKNNNMSVFNQRNVAQEQLQSTFIRSFPKTNKKLFKPLRCCFEREGLLKYKKYDVYCQVENKQFTVKNTKESKEIIICIRFDIFPSSVKIIYNSQGKALFLRLQILTPKLLEYDFYHQDSNEIQSWFKDLNYQILIQQDQISLKPEYSLLDNFQKKVFITEQEFVSDADSLDLVFFVGKSFGSKITRIVSQSEYDHVALVLRGANDQIFFFEAGQNNGVSLYSWDKFKNYNWRDFYKFIVFRKLNCVRTNLMIDNLEKFVKSAAGKSYELSLSKLFKKNSFVNQIESEEGRTYFCSELIAAAYKRMGLLPKEISSAQYWPKNFSEQGQINLQIENSYLSEEKIIYI